MAGRAEYLLERILNESRGFLIDDTTDYDDEVNIAGFSVLEDAVIANLEIDGSDALAGMNLTGKTLTTLFPPIMAGKDKRFNRIKLTSGVVWAITTTDEGSVT
jgi:hypothetical protein